MALAFITADGCSLTINTLTVAIRQALQVNGHPSLALFTMQSLCRGSAQACAQAGVSAKDVCKLGAWKSHAMDAYVP